MSKSLPQRNASHLPPRLELAERALRDLNSWCADIETSTLTVADVQNVVRSVVAAYFDNVNLGIYAGGMYDDDRRVHLIEPDVWACENCGRGLSDEAARLATQCPRCFLHVPGESA